MSAIHCLVERNHHDILLEVIKHYLSESLSEEKLSKDKWLQVLDDKKMTFEEKLLNVKELPRPKELGEIVINATKVYKFVVLAVGVELELSNIDMYGKIKI